MKCICIAYTKHIAYAIGTTHKEESNYIMYSKDMYSW